MFQVLACSTLIGNDPRSTADSQTEVDARVRLSFSADQPRGWNVRVAIVDTDGKPTSDGAISEVENHCTSVASTGSLRLSDDGHALSLKPRKTMLGGSIQFRLRAADDAKLSIAFEPSRDAASSGTLGDSNDALPANAGQRTLVPLGEVLAGQITTAEQQLSEDRVAENGVKWLLQRVAGDELRIDFGSRSNFVAPESEFSFSVQSNSMIAVASRSLVLRYELYRVADGQVVSEKNWPVKVDANGHTQPMIVSESAPANPGVYEVRCSLESDDGNLWSRLRRRAPPLVLVGRPIVVPPQIEPSPSTGATQTWSTVGEIRPSHTAAWSVSQWLPATTNRLIPGSDPPGDLTDDKHAGEKISLIEPDGVFQATVPVMAPGLPHRVTVRYPAGQSMRMRVEVAGVGKIDDPDLSFVLINDKWTNAEGGWSSHTFVHYPSSGDQIRLTNLDAIERVAFEIDHGSSGSRTFGLAASRVEVRASRGVAID